MEPEEKQENVAVQSPPLAYGIGSSSVLGSNKGDGQKGGQSKRLEGSSESFDPRFDLVQYDATIPDSSESEQEVPVLLADPFSNSQDVDSDEERKEESEKSSDRPSTSFEQPNFLYDLPKRG